MCRGCFVSALSVGLPQRRRARSDDPAAAASPRPMPSTGLRQQAYAVPTNAPPAPRKLLFAELVEATRSGRARFYDTGRGSQPPPDAFDVAQATGFVALTNAPPATARAPVC